MKKLLTLTIFAFAIGSFCNSCKNMPNFVEGCREERAIVLMNNSDEVLTFYALDTGGFVLKADVPAHTTQHEWLKTGAWKFMVDDKSGKTINSFPGIEAYMKLDSGTLDPRFYSTQKTDKGSTWVLWRVDTVARFSHYDPTIWYDLTGSHNYASAPIDFMYGDDKGKDEAWFAKQLANIDPGYYSGRRPFICYAKTTFNMKVFGPKEKFPKQVGKYNFHYCLVSLDTTLTLNKESVTRSVIEDMMGRGLTSESVDYLSSTRRLGDCK